VNHTVACQHSILLFKTAIFFFSHILIPRFIKAKTTSLWCSQVSKLTRRSQVCFAKLTFFFKTWPPKKRRRQNKWTQHLKIWTEAEEERKTKTKSQVAWRETHDEQRTTHKTSKVTEKKWQHGDTLNNYSKHKVRQ